MNNYISVKIIGPYLNVFLRKSINNKIYFKKVTYVNKSCLKVIMLKKDYLKLKKLSKDYKIKKLNELGINYYKNIFKDNIILISSFFIMTILLFLLSNIMIEINVLHSDTELRRMIKLELEDHGIKKYSYKKNYNEIQNIKLSLLQKHKDKIEWIEIIPEGMTYTIRLEERIINKIVDSNKKCHIVSKKDALIKEISGAKGEKLVELNDYVTKGEILISGNIAYNNEIKESLCASGKIYGEVWYRVNIEMPLVKVTTTRTNKKQYNIRINKTKIFNSKYKNHEDKEKLLFKFFDNQIYFDTEYEIIKKSVKLTDGEALNLALIEMEKSFSHKNDEFEEILSKKVLKKQINNSTMKIEVFVAVKEDISSVLEYS